MVIQKRFVSFVFFSFITGNLIAGTENLSTSVTNIVPQPITKIAKDVQVSRFQQILNKLSKTDFGTAGRILKFLLPLCVVGGMTSLEDKLGDYPILADASKALCAIAILALFQDPNGNIAKNISKDSIKIGIIFGLSLIANSRFVLSLLNKIPYDFGKFLLTKDEQDALKKGENEIKSSIGFGSIARNVLPYFAIKKAIEKIYGISLD